MRKRGRRNCLLQVWLSPEEKADYLRKAQKCCFNQSALFRMLIKGYEPKEKPDEEFYVHMRSLSGIANNINQLAIKANTYGYIDGEELDGALKRLNEFQLAIQKKYLEPEKSSIWQ